ncbi:MAG: hypothetical protein K0R03_1421 [Moraxellaceae bacterium]|jgi:8-oxo-dGTP diphosphatase|nr:hypothetical protein [Moraxellaceae bacterium]
MEKPRKGLFFGCNSMKRILVVAAVIRRDGKILIAQRPTDKHQGGLWEFPGGKVEAGEPVEQALVRELEEELGITPQQFRPLIRITHDYADKAVCLDVWEVSAFTGEAHGRENQPVQWVRNEELQDFTFPAANLPIIAAARLPAHYFITPANLDAAGYVDWLERRLERGAELILLRAPQLPAAEYRDMARDLSARCRAGGATLILHGDPQLLQQVDADGIHLTAAQLGHFPERPCGTGRWLAASVHDARELAQAERIGADFVTLSPVQATTSHPGAVALGWERFAALTGPARIPVYALGGMSMADAGRAWSAGAQGVAGISGF